MPKRINISLSDDFYLWLSTQAKENGIPVSAYATMLLNQAKKNIENTETMQAYLKQFSNLPPEILAAELSRMASEEDIKK